MESSIEKYLIMPSNVEGENFSNTARTVIYSDVEGGKKVKKLNNFNEELYG
jgi:hypothetical protein